MAGIDKVQEALVDLISEAEQIEHLAEQAGQHQLARRIALLNNELKNLEFDLEQVRRETG